MAQEKQHLTTEQLSTYLDKQLSAEERSNADEHLAVCEQCQQVLAELQEMVALLRALPQPALPRSFVLPSKTRIADESADMSLAEPVPITIAATAAVPISASEYRRRPVYIWATLRAISALAAMFGLVMFLSGLLTTLLLPTPTATSTSSMPMIGEHADEASPQVNAEKQARTYSSPQSNPTTPAEFLFFNLHTPTGRLVFGCLLLLLGSMGLITFRQRKKVQRKE